MGSKTMKLQELQKLPDFLMMEDEVQKLYSLNPKKPGILRSLDISHIGKKSFDYLNNKNGFSL